MDKVDLRHIWNQSSKKSEIMIKSQELLSAFKTNMEHREHIVRKRDRKEIVLAGIAIIGNVFLAMQFWFSMAAIGLLFIAITYVYYIYKLRINRKSRHTHELFLPLKEQLKHQKQFMLKQANLLNTVLYWAALPMFAGIVLYTWSIWDLESYNFSSFGLEIYPVKLSSKIISTVFTALVFGYIVWINKKAVKVNWMPLITQIDKILKEMKTEQQQP